MRASTSAPDSVSRVWSACSERLPLPGQRYAEGVLDNPGTRRLSGPVLGGQRRLDEADHVDRSGDGAEEREEARGPCSGTGLRSSSASTRPASALWSKWIILVEVARTVLRLLLELLDGLLQRLDLPIQRRAFRWCGRSPGARGRCS